MTIVAEQTFVAPGPGSWVLDPTHQTRPVTRFHAETFPDPFKRGFSESLRRYGSLLEYLEAGFVNGFVYYCACPVGAPREAVGHPPKKVWEELARTHPEIRRRLSTSATVFERKLWRADLQRWDLEVKPAAIRTHLALLKIDPDTLDTTGLLQYLNRCRENQIQAAYIHHLFNAPAFVPVGDFLVCAQEWTGRAPAQLLGLLQGANPDPLGADQDLECLVGALRHDAAATKLLTSAREPGEVVAELRTFPGEVGALASAYVDRVAYRPVNGEDVGEPSVQEIPELIVGAIRAALEGVDISLANDLERKTAEVRDAVPAQHRIAFDELLGEAQRPTGSATSVAPTPTSGRSGSCDVQSCRPAAGLQLEGGSSIRPTLSRGATRRCEAWSRPATAPPATSWPSVRATGSMPGTRMRHRFSATSPATHCLPNGSRPPRRGWNARSEPSCRRSSPRRRHAQRSGRCAALASAEVCTKAPHGSSAAPKSSVASSTATSWLRTRRRQPSTSCSPCSVRS